MNRIAFAFALLMITGCESGDAAVIDLTVSDSLATSFTSTSPGVLRASTSLGAVSYAALCGSTQSPLELVKDFGLGCLSDVGSSTEPMQAWVEPLPADWNAVAFCKLVAAPRGLSLRTAAPASADGGVDDTLAAQPDASWHQAQTTADWTRDGSACGGIARGTLTLQ